MPQKRSTSLKFQPKELVLAKMHGFPAWPSFVMPNDMIPEAVFDFKKKSTEYCVIFIPDGDYYWMTDKSLELLSKESLAKKLQKIPRKPPKLKNGRTVNVNDALLAAENLSFEEYMRKLNKEGTNNAELVDDNEADDTGEDVVEEDIEPEDDKSKTSRKAKEEVKLEASEDTESSNIGSRRLRRKARTEIAESRSSKTRKLEETPTSTPTPTPASKNMKKSDTPVLEEERRHQLWLCRIKLQRSLIQRNQPVTPTNPKEFAPPSPDELSVARLILHRLSDFPVTLDLLRKTKIHKVIKCILREKDLELADSFKLHEKCNELLAKWAPLVDELKIEKQSLSMADTDDTSSKDTFADEKSSNLEKDDSEISTLAV